MYNPQVTTNNAGYKRFGLPGNQETPQMAVRVGNQNNQPIRVPGWQRPFNSTNQSFYTQSHIIQPNNIANSSIWNCNYPNVDKIEAESEKTLAKADSYILDRNAMKSTANQDECKLEIQVEGKVPQAISVVAFPPVVQSLQSEHEDDDEEEVRLKKSRQVEQMKEQEIDEEEEEENEENDQLHNNHNQQEANISTLSNKVYAHSQNHYFIKHLLHQIHQLKLKLTNQEIINKQNKSKIKNIKNREIQRQNSDRLENIMQKATLYSAFAIVCFLIVLVVGKIVAENGNDSKRSQLKDLQQQVIQPVGRIDLSKYENLKQTKQPSERIEESNKRLLTAGASASASASSSSASLSLMEKFRQGGAREMEWEPRENEQLQQAEQKRKPKLFMSPGAHSAELLEIVPAFPKGPKGQPELVPKEAPQQGDTCSNCIKENYLAHYYQKGCKPVKSRECDCAKFFRCPRKPVKPVLAKEEAVKVEVEKDAPCIYNSKVYSIGERIPNPDEPCRVCRCRRRQFFNGTVTKSYGEIDCSLFVECPEMVFGVKPKRDTCHFAYRHDQCCGTEICTDELPPEDKKVRTTCKYRSKVFKFGEMIYPEENSCLKCVCDETWNEHDPASSGGCKQRQCSAFLQENILQKCTPIYRIDGCCPIDFICPEKRKLYDRDQDRQQEVDNQSPQEAESSNKDLIPIPSVDDEEIPSDGYMASSKDTITDKCIHEGVSYALGQKLYVDRRQTQHGRTCARCECKVPPQLTCQADFRCTGNN